jgi:hypothetical protein
MLLLMDGINGYMPGVPIVAFNIQMLPFLIYILLLAVFGQGVKLFIV